MCDQATHDRLDRLFLDLAIPSEAVTGILQRRGVTQVAQLSQSDAEQLIAKLEAERTEQQFDAIGDAENPSGN